MKVALALLAVALLTGCAAEEPLSPAASASASCDEVGDLFARPALRTADVARLDRAQDAAEAAATGERRWQPLAASMARLHEAAAEVAASAQRATGNREQHALNTAYTEAKSAAARLCTS